MPAPKAILKRWILKEIRYDDADWTNLAQDGGQMQSSCEDGDEPSDSINGGEFLD
jgi:hypothetical protein